MIRWLTLIFILGVFGVESRPSILGRLVSHKLDQRAPIDYQVLWFDQDLDHFNFAVQPQKFRQRYLVNDKFWDRQNNGPIFFYTGNEGDIEWFAHNTGFVWEIAPKFGAMVVFAEHRYYGQSLPFGNQSFVGTNPGYLSVSQALSDYANLIRHIKESYGIWNTAYVPVIAFGGSYGGMLSAWFRVKYPHLVDGALAASAPILQFTGVTSPEIFNKLTTQDFIEQNSQCDSHFRETLNTIQSIFANQGDLVKLQQDLRLCQPLQRSTDGPQVINWMTNGLVNLAMTDYPYPSSFLEPMGGWPVNQSCSIFSQCLQQQQGSLMSCAGAAMAAYYNGTGQVPCYNISSDATSDLGEQGWDYQSCTEMVMPISQTGTTDMFLPAPWDPESFTASCIKKWGVAPRYDWAVTEFGANRLQAASNIIFSNGMLDPWRGGSVTQSLSPSLVAINIFQAAHHLDLRSSNREDPSYVVEARNQEIQLISQFIENARQRNF